MKLSSRVYATLGCGLAILGAVVTFGDLQIVGGGDYGRSRLLADADAPTSNNYQEDEDGNRFACAAFSVCGDPCDANRADTCAESIDLCNDRVERIDGPLGSSLAVLTSNPTYRVKDILYTQGLRWRIDSMTILGEPRYRGTLLRQTLIRTATWDRWGNGTHVPLHTLTPTEVENIVQSNSDVEGQQPGTACLEGYKGGNGIALAGPNANLAAFASLLTEMYEGGRCTALQKTNGEDDNPLIVPFRMGDVIMPDAVAEDWAKTIKEQLAGKKRTVQIRGALHYGHNCLGLGKNVWAPEKDDGNVKVLSKFVEMLQEQDGINVEIESIPSADQDVCAILFGEIPHLDGGHLRGFHLLKPELKAHMAKSSTE